jgi:carboxymethylenebutenolidase
MTWCICFEPLHHPAIDLEADLSEPLSNRYLAVPASGKGPGVLVLHAWWGLNDIFREVCDRLAHEGFVALAPDLFSGEVLHTVAEAEQHLSRYDEGAGAPPIILSAVDALAANPAVSGKGLGVMGFSMGAYWALWLAQEKPELFRAVTLFYGTNGGEGDFHPSKAAFLGHFAERDPYESAEGIAALETNLKGAGRPTAFYTYPGAGHWFFENDRPDAYDPQAAQLAWDRTIAFLHEQLG